MDAFTGQSEIGRTSLLLGKSDKVMYRKGDYVIIPPHNGPKMTNKYVNIETGRDTILQLYNLREDKEQQHNLAEDKPEIVEQLLKEIEAIKEK